MKYSVFIVFVLCVLGLSGTVCAQINTISPTEINVSMLPENPGPNQPVSISLTSFATDINNANITWKIDGKTQKQGIGEKAFSFTAGAMGKETRIDITAVTAEGETINKTVVINPSTVDLIWQSDGFVPPFYKGKSLFSHQDRVTVIALPHITSGGGELSAKNLVYKWKNNDNVMEASSGYGKNSYTFDASLISRPVDIEVDITSPDTGDTAVTDITLSPIDPSIVFYQKNPLYGIEFQKALTGTVFLDSSKEITVTAMPFYFGAVSPSSSNLTYTWSINGSPVNNTSSQTEVFRQKEGTSGASNISLSIENSSKILQSASESFNLLFGATNNVQPSL